MSEAMQAGILGLLSTALVAVIGWMAKQQGDKTQAQAATDARWKSMLDAATRTFEVQLEPMRRSIDDLRGEVDRLKDARRRDREKFREAATYIHVLLSWIRRHVPDKTPPKIPDVLANEL